MGLLHGCVWGNFLCPDLEHVVDLNGVERQVEGQWQGRLVEERLEKVQCIRSYCKVVGKGMAYAVAFVVKQRGARVAVVRSGL